MGVDLEELYLRRLERLAGLDERVNTLPPMSQPDSFRTQVQSILRDLIKELR